MLNSDISLLLLIRRSMSAPGNQSVGSKGGLSASARWAKGDDLSFDEGEDDDESITNSKPKPKLVVQSASPPRSPSSPKKFDDSATPVNVSFTLPRRDSLLGAEPSSYTPTPTADQFPQTPSRVNFSTEPPISIPLRPVVSRESEASSVSSVGRHQRNYI